MLIIKKITRRKNTFNRKLQLPFEASNVCNLIIVIEFDCEWKQNIKNCEKSAVVKNTEQKIVVRIFDKKTSKIQQKKKAST